MRTESLWGCLPLVLLRSAGRGDGAGAALRVPWGCLPFVLLRSAGRGDGVRAALFQREALLEPRLVVKRATQSCALLHVICEAL